MNKIAIAEGRYTGKYVIIYSYNVHHRILYRDGSENKYDKTYIREIFYTMEVSNMALEMLYSKDISNKILIYNTILEEWKKKS